MAHQLVAALHKRQMGLVDGLVQGHRRLAGTSPAMTGWGWRS
jgi:hypothetical protein